MIDAAESDPVGMLRFFEQNLTQHSGDLKRVINTPYQINQNKQTLLMRSVNRGFADTTKWLMEHGADIKQVDCLGATCLFHAVVLQNPKPIFDVFSQLSNPQYARRPGYRNLKDIINKANGDGRTPLMEAFGLGGADAIKWLIDNGADTQLKDKSGASALHYLPHSNNAPGVLKLDQYLQKMRPMINMQNKEGVTPLMAAAQGKSPEVVEYLLKQGADTTMVDAKGASYLIYAVTSQNPKPIFDMLGQLSNPGHTWRPGYINLKDVINKANTYGATPLMYAFGRGGKVEVIKWLVDHGADITLKNKDGESALFYLAESENVSEIAKLDAYIQPLEGMVNMPNNKGETPIMTATYMCNTDGVRWFLDKGADIKCKNIRGENLYSYVNNIADEALKQEVLNVFKAHPTSAKWIIDRINGVPEENVQPIASAAKAGGAGVVSSEPEEAKQDSDQQAAPEPETPATEPEEKDTMEVGKYTITLSDETAKNLGTYKKELSWGFNTPGAHFAAQLKLVGKEVKDMSSEEFINALLATKQTDFFAEKNLKGNGEDWNNTEISILGDIGLGIRVKIYDNMGRGQGLIMHEEPLEGYLLFVNGALLGANGFKDGAAAFPDYKAVVNADGAINQENFNLLIENRLSSQITYLNSEAKAQGTKAIVTIPGLGCGEFAGTFQGSMGERLHKAIKATLQKHADNWGNIALVRLDTFNECRYEEEAEANAQYGSVAYRLRPLMNMNFKTPGGCHPTAYQENDDNFANYIIGKVVAWDHVGKPGNEGLKYRGRGGTDDAIASNSTNLKRLLSGEDGFYDSSKNVYVSKKEPEWVKNQWGDEVPVESLHERVILKAGAGHVMVVDSKRADIMAEDLNAYFRALDSAAVSAATVEHPSANPQAHVEPPAQGVKPAQSKLKLTSASFVFGSNDAQASAAEAPAKVPALTQPGGISAAASEFTPSGENVAMPGNERELSGDDSDNFDAFTPW